MTFLSSWSKTQVLVLFINMSGADYFEEKEPNKNYPDSLKSWHQFLNKMPFVCLLFHMAFIALFYLHLLIQTD